MHVPRHSPSLTARHGARRTRQRAGRHARIQKDRALHHGSPPRPRFHSSQHGLLPRDLRKLEVGPQASSPSILVRKSSILVNLLHIRALVKADKVLVFDVTNGGDSHAQSIFMWDLEGKLRQGSKAMGGLSYELRPPRPLSAPLTTGHWKVF
jgi:hypothetical protein